MELHVKDVGAVMDRIAAKNQATLQAAIEQLSVPHQATYGEGLIKGARMAGAQQACEQIGEELAIQMAVENPTTAA